MNYTKKALGMATLFLGGLTAQAETVKIGMNYPETGPYSVQGLDQWRAASIALEEINAAGGILGKQVEIIKRDSQSKKDVTITNVTDLIDNEGVEMVFGGSSSGVAVAAGQVANEKNKLFFGTLTYSNTVTAEQGFHTTFRECYNSWMAAKAISSYLKANFAGKKYFYITADYNWGWSTEKSIRKFSETEDDTVHKGTLTPFPGATDADFKKALSFAKLMKPDVLVLVLFGKDMSSAVRIATAMGLKKDVQIIVPNLTLGMAEGGGPEVMEGVVGALPWTWQVPYKYDYPAGKAFVEKFKTQFNRYPSTSGASAYTILHQYKEAVERAGTFETEAVITALKGHKYTLLKDEQQWRDFDHQSIQTVYAVKCKAPSEVRKDPLQLDYFEIISKISGEEAARTFDEWAEARKSAGLPPAYK